MKTTVGDHILIAQIYNALYELRRANSAWGKNMEIFQGMDAEHKLRWWLHVQKQAALGVPAMQELVSAVILLKLTT